MSKITKRLRGQHAYCKYLEINQARVFEWEQKQVGAAAQPAAKTLCLHHHIVGGALINAFQYIGSQRCLKCGTMLIKYTCISCQLVHTIFFTNYVT